MKTLLTLIVISSLVGIGLGGAMAYFEVRATAPKPLPNQPALVDSSAKQPQKSQQFPRLQLAEKVYDFDRIERGTSMRHDFAVQNVGTAPLVIRFESNTCKCTGVEFDGKLVSPGAKVALQPEKVMNVTLEWAAKTAAGPFRHGARFTTNDPSNTSFDLYVNGKVVESTAMRPSELIFGTIKSGESQLAQMYLMSFLDEKVEVLDYEVSPAELAEYIDVQFEEAGKDALPDPEAIGGLKITATFRSGDSLGPFRGWLNLKTTLDGAEKLTVPIIGSVTGPISIYGPGWNRAKGLLTLGRIQTSVGKSVRLNLAVRGEEANATQFEVASVEPAELQVTLGEPREMSDTMVHVPVEVSIPPNTSPVVRMGEPTSSDAEIVFKSNHPQVKEVKMRVHFAVSR